ncbi:putative F-box domain, galactose oxidase/kelch, beta-propeller, F-box associated interaction [Rosa chinensis]|uniref:Putative F-box domain, galactose oxidase/kelch, beta-propeller, F-box associated interaction n=1 Tax=Rosa chinensis TaxID=74649 RepID=A0A2P6RCE5_ROSCH|nr:F-box/kelch-repeat protein At3g06240 [Rosa chinensis]PRQ44091.1 putative F-box domain, galactose oxidase/kelch, beta-propeller, F-box associated interaction [Rosa chinensis]
MAEFIPEDVIVKVLERLPIKSLIRFTCVSKRWRFIILSDPQFAKTHYKVSCEHQTIRHRLLFNSPDKFGFDSLDSESPLSFGDNSCVRKVRIPFLKPGDILSMPRSCNGLVCAAVIVSLSPKILYHWYIWNPSTGFFKKLPDPSMNIVYLQYYGIGYLSATDDYKILKPREIFSSRANVWKTIEFPNLDELYLSSEGIRSNEALHWFHAGNADIVAFDLSIEEFRSMPLPTTFEHGCFIHLAASVGGCLCAFDLQNVKASGSIYMWVMREYGVADSWTKLFNFKVSSQPEDIRIWGPIFLGDTSIIFEFQIAIKEIDGGRIRMNDFKLIRSVHENAEKLETCASREFMIAYEETLLWLND